MQQGVDSQLVQRSLRGLYTDFLLGLWVNVCGWRGLLISPLALQRELETWQEVTKARGRSGQP